jgi:hypothetical protein
MSQQNKRVSMASLVADKANAVIPERMAELPIGQSEGRIGAHPATQPSQGTEGHLISQSAIDAAKPPSEQAADRPLGRQVRTTARGPVGQPTSPLADQRERWEAEPKAASPTTTISFRAPIELDERLRAYTFHRRALRQDLLCGLLDDFLASKGF